MRKTARRSLQIQKEETGAEKEEEGSEGDGEGEGEDDQDKEQKVRVFRTLQRPGEFVVTFPKAYHMVYTPAPVI